ncbi:MULTISPECIES: PTS sugar transporter subunit IIA [unclassified Clostridioides]|uniref:PTS sugar transporter subunit IIA n=1 Tax=unclassified Clostridioides TaxID=2635829 RepID=UPI001D11AD1B|nr:PTS sugar transporter subunit IIA [Clostridioides sp. ZZV15-6388]MCC0642727.1 PTS sugar transporter subunit IIA [Clostridioides sp. ZZV14-6150]MCC0660325.1 PTS sugar transporter subunit IIA [Clostridioides sp. ZZV14-6154]MCC0666226.1 PTS sugar transporter subunit IIA [Clostridioides sp. ZZV15-6597]MCC0667512.1 PTS sugar transporter subunit IIA [Clostridioides sp. ZZV14-6153]MCC0720341.1 PTS sugar transporter subunit IIA [Clostridioides sp. ZZV14-6105]MCC0720875.1 PTS sugar transporter subu
MNVDLISLGLEANDYESIIRELGNKMYQKKYVKNTYINAVLEREKTLPTGLNIGEMCVAIPHTDSQHVNESNVAVGILKNPVKFNSMIDPTDNLDVELVFLLAVKNPDSQVKLLKDLMSVFQNIKLLRDIKNASTKEEVAELLNFIEI